MLLGAAQLQRALEASQATSQNGPALIRMLRLWRTNSNERRFLADRTYGTSFSQCIEQGPEVRGEWATPADRAAVERPPHLNVAGGTHRTPHLVKR